MGAKLKPCGVDVAAVVPANRAGVAAAEEAPEAVAEAMPKDSGVEAGAAAVVLAGSGVLTAAAKEGALGVLAEAPAGVLAGVDENWKPPGAAGTEEDAGAGMPKDGAAVEAPAHTKALKKLLTCQPMLSDSREAWVDLKTLCVSL